MRVYGARPFLPLHLFPAEAAEAARARALARTAAATAAAAAAALTLSSAGPAGPAATASARLAKGGGAPRPLRGARDEAGDELGRRHEDCADGGADDADDSDDAADDDADGAAADAAADAVARWLRLLARERARRELAGGARGAGALPLPAAPLGSHQRRTEQLFGWLGRRRRLRLRDYRLHAAVRRAGAKGVCAGAGAGPPAGPRIAAALTGGLNDGAGAGSGDGSGGAGEGEGDEGCRVALGVVSGIDGVANGNNGGDGDATQRSDDSYAAAGDRDASGRPARSASSLAARVLAEEHCLLSRRLSELLLIGRTLLARPPSAPPSAPEPSRSGAPLPETAGAADDLGALLVEIEKEEARTRAGTVAGDKCGADAAGSCSQRSASSATAADRLVLVRAAAGPAHRPTANPLFSYY
jgi:hypothetical protein